MDTALLDNAVTRRSSANNERIDKGGKYLTFKLADEEYGIEILKVREINGLMDITSVPKMPACMKGVINLRGKVIPVIDLRLTFGLCEAKQTEQTCIIVVNVGREVGIIVDTVSEVVDIQGSSIEPPPAIGSSVDTSFILGMGKVGSAVKILLDIEKALAGDDLAETVAVTDDPSATAEADVSSGVLPAF